MGNALPPLRRSEIHRRTWRGWRREAREFPAVAAAAAVRVLGLRCSPHCACLLIRRLPPYLQKVLRCPNNLRKLTTIKKFTKSTLRSIGIKMHKRWNLSNRIRSVPCNRGSRSGRSRGGCDRTLRRCWWRLSPASAVASRSRTRP